MIANAKAKGRRREHRARDLLERDGYVVTRAAGSLGVFDLVAVRRDPQPDDYLPVVKLVQVKSNRWPGRAECEALAAEARRYGRPFVACEVWRIDDRNGTPRVRAIE